MKNKIKYLKLLREYEELKNKIMEIDDRFHDGMYYDLMGYYEEEYEYLPELESQVKACRSLLKGLKGLNYIFC